MKHEAQESGLSLNCYVSMDVQVVKLLYTKSMTLLEAHIITVFNMNLKSATRQHASVHQNRWTQILPGNSFIAFQQKQIYYSK